VKIAYDEDGEIIWVYSGYDPEAGFSFDNTVELDGEIGRKVKRNTDDYRWDESKDEIVKVDGTS